MYYISGGLVALRFRSDNPGAWAIHCHLDQHQEDGQILVMDEGEYRMPVKDFPKDYPSCDYKGFYYYFHFERMYS